MVVTFPEPLRPRLVLGVAAVIAIATGVRGSLAIVTAQTPSRPPTPSSLGAPFVRDPAVAIDEDYTRKIKEYTTAASFASPLVDYLPASKSVPTPKAVLGDIAAPRWDQPAARDLR